MDAVFQVGSHQSEVKGRQGGMNTSYTGKGLISIKNIFYSGNKLPRDMVKSPEVFKM